MAPGAGMALAPTDLLTDQLGAQTMTHSPNQASTARNDRSTDHFGRHRAPQSTAGSHWRPKRSVQRSRDDPGHRFHPSSRPCRPGLPKVASSPSHRPSPQASQPPENAGPSRGGGWPPVDRARSRPSRPGWARPKQRARRPANRTRKALPWHGPATARYPRQPDDNTDRPSFRHRHPSDARDAARHGRGRAWRRRLRR